GLFFRDRSAFAGVLRSLRVRLRHQRSTAAPFAATCERDAGPADAQASATNATEHTAATAGRGAPAAIAGGRSARALRPASCSSIARQAGAAESPAPPDWLPWESAYRARERAPATHSRGD